MSTRSVCLALVAAGCMREEAQARAELKLPSFRLILTHHQVQAVMPVVDSLAAELAKTAHKYPELSDYEPGSSKVLSERRVGLQYGHNFTPPRSKRGIRTSDFGEHGFHVRFVCAPKPSRWGPVYSMGPPSRTLRNLCLHLWTDLKTAPDPSAALVLEVDALLRSHAERLVAIDEKLYHGALRAPKVPPELRGEHDRLSGEEIWKRVREVILWFPTRGERSELNDEEERRIVREMLPSLSPEQLLDAAREAVKEGESWMRQSPDGRTFVLACLDFLFKHYSWAVSRAAGTPVGFLPEPAPLLEIAGSRDEPAVLIQAVIELLSRLRVTKEQEDGLAQVLLRTVRDREAASELRLGAARTLWSNATREFHDIVRTDAAYVDMIGRKKRFQFNGSTTVWLLREKQFPPETREKLKPWREAVRELANIFEEERRKSSDELFRKRMDGMVGTMEASVRGPEEAGLKGSPD